ncbi:MAG: hypothetical protein WEF86_00825 [Gemmatimonadota bacterium]
MRTQPQPAREPAALHAHAMDNLRYIRRTMERAGSFTALSGWGFVAAGVTGLVAAPLAALQPTKELWLTTWLAAALLSLLITGGATLRKARLAGEHLLAGPGRKLLLSFSPPAVAALLLTPVLFGAGLTHLLPPLWLLLYGAGVVTGGTFSVRIVPVMGVSCMVIGATALLVPAAWGDVLMAIGFGAVHVAAGVLIARRHGG